MNVFVYKWTPKFKDLCDKRNGRCVSSPVFHTMANETFIYWQVEFYPNGRKPLCHDKCSIFLHLVGSNTNYERISAKFQFELSRSKEPPYQTPLSDQHDFIKNKISDTSLCFHRFAPSFSLMQMKELLLLGEDRILIKCTIELPKAAFKRIITDHIPSITTPTSCPNLESFEELVSKTHDVIISTKGGRQFYCHKDILAAKCYNFKHMFDINETSKFIEEEPEIKTTPVHSLPDVDGKVMMEVLRFLYTNGFNVEKLRQLAAQVLPIADRYLLGPLRNKCAELMIETLTRENAIDYLILGDRFIIAELKKRAVTLIVDELKEIIEEPNWKPFLKDNPTLVEYIFEEVVVHNVLAAF